MRNEGEQGAAREASEPAQHAAELDALWLVLQGQGGYFI